MTRIRPCGGYVLVRREKPPENSRLAAIGLATPETALKPVTRGVVVETGNGRLNEHGVWMPMLFQVGDRIVWDRDGAHEVPWEKDLLIVSSEYVLAELVEEAE